MLFFTVNICAANSAYCDSTGELLETSRIKQGTWTRKKSECVFYKSCSAVGG